MKTLYLDLFSGISGDMFVGAVLDLGVDLHALEHELEKLGLDDFHLHTSRQQRGAIAGTKFDVHLEDEDDDASHSHAKHEHGHHHDHDEDHDDDHAHHHDHGHAHSHEKSSHHHEHEHGRNFRDLKELILRSKLSDWVK